MLVCGFTREIAGGGSWRLGKQLALLANRRNMGKHLVGLFVVVRMTGITAGGDRKGTASEWRPMSKADICECTE